MNNTQLLSLVEYLAYKAGCEYISDLPRMGPVGKRKAGKALENVAPDMYTLKQWNDALSYIAGKPEEDTPELARQVLAEALQV